MNKPRLLTFVLLAASSLLANAVPVAAPSTPVSMGGLLVPAGVNNNLSVFATGDPTLMYQWKKNNVKVGVATTSSLLSFNPMKATDGGTWNCTVSNAVPSTATTPGALVTVADVSKFAPTPINEGGTLTATITLSPANAAAGYHWYITGNDTLSGVGTVTGQNTRSLVIKNITVSAGAVYHCDITLGAAMLTLSTTLPVINPKPVVHIVPDQIKQVGDNISIIVPIDNTPTSATVSGLPSGLKYAFSSGAVSITGKPTTPTSPHDPAAVVITGTNKVGKSAPMAFPMTILPLDPGVIGTFNGIIPRSSGNPNTSLGGKISVTITAAGTATGNATLGTFAYPFTTQVTPTDLETAQISMTGVKSGSQPVLDFTFTVTSDDLTGTLTCNGQNYAADALRNVWHTYNQVALPGNFNCAFQPGTTEFNSASYPHGSSFGTLTVSTLGAVTFSGRMADGTVVTASSTLAEGGDVPLFAVLYSGNGSIVGTPNIDDIAVTGALNWNKLPAAGGRLYTAGFAPHNLACTGSFYVKPNATLGRIFIGLPAGVNNALLSFSDSSNASLKNTVYQPVTVSVMSVPSIAAGSALPAGSTANLTLNAATGAINGNFTVTDQKPLAAMGVTVTRTGTYYGLAVPGSPSKAYGFYNLPDLPFASADPKTNDISKNAMTSGVALMTETK